MSEYAWDKLISDDFDTHILFNILVFALNVMKSRVFFEFSHFLQFLALESLFW